MLVVKKKSFSLLWELNFFFHVNSSRKKFYFIDPKHGRLFHVVVNQELRGDPV